MCPSLQWHLGGGEGWIKHFMDHLMGPMAASFARLGNPEVTQELKNAIIAGVLQEADSRSVEQLAEDENGLLVKLLRLRAQQASSAQSKVVANQRSVAAGKSGRGLDCESGFQITGEPGATGTRNGGLRQAVEHRFFSVLLEQACRFTTGMNAGKGRRIKQEKVSITIGYRGIWLPPSSAWAVKAVANVKAKADPHRITKGSGKGSSDVFNHTDLVRV